MVRELFELDAVLEGAEDVRLFSLDGALWGICCRPISGAALSCGMSLIKLDADLLGAKAIPLAPPYGSSREKNWLPIVYNGMLHFVYSLEPLVVLRCEPSSGRLDFVDPSYAEYSGSSFTFLLCGSAAWTADWHIRDETHALALRRLINQQHREPLAAVFAGGSASSSDGQFLGPLSPYDS